MKKLGFFLFALILSLSFIGCKNKTTSNQNTSTNNNASIEVKQNKLSEKEYKNKVNETLKDLYTRINFDYKKALEDYDFEFLAFNTSDMNKAEQIFNDSKIKYSKVKDSSFKDVNDKVENILLMYQKVLDGRRLVFKHKGDNDFLNTGYSKNVVTPINDAKKAIDEFNKIGSN